MEPRLDSALQAFIAQQMGGGAPGMRPSNASLNGILNANTPPVLPRLPVTPYEAQEQPVPFEDAPAPPEDMVAPGPAPTGRLPYGPMDDPSTVEGEGLPPAERLQLGPLDPSMIEGSGMPADPLTDIVAGSIDAINSIPRAENPRPAVPGEQVYQSWQRFTGRPWPGGRSQEVVELLKDLGITAPPGSMEANLALQKFLQ